MPAPELLTITAGPVVADVAPADGGRLAQLTVGGVPLLVGWSPDLPDTGWGAYPMVPWAGRIRRGRFEFDGVSYQLPINFETHAIHGLGFTSAWQVTAHDDHSIELHLDMPSDDRWPFGGRAEQRFTVDADGITLTMTVRADDRAFPVSFGWHPWFVKPATLDFRPTAMYPRDDEWIALPDTVDVPPPPWDDAFVNTEPVVAVVDGVELRLTSDCSTWVVFDMREHATCIEPQTAPPDAFNTTSPRIGPGEHRTAWYRMDTRSLPA